MSAAARMAGGKSNVPSRRISTSIPCKMEDVGEASARALACLNHKSGVRPPCNLLDRLWSVTAKYCKPALDVAADIELIEAAPSDHAVWRCRSASKVLSDRDAMGSRRSAS